jgi:hypothetical protein
MVMDMKKTKQRQSEVVFNSPVRMEAEGGGNWEEKKKDIILHRIYIVNTVLWRKQHGNITTQRMARRIVCVHGKGGPNMRIANIGNKLNK